ncbi:hypothetical protein OAC97_04355 [Flavobacteriaceae bacterium]|nr:hypothetical protein [Flavobacteriaceae bacterium]
MKKIKILSVLLVLASFMACDKEDAVVSNVYDNSGQTGVGFLTSSVSTVVPAEGSSVTLNVQATTTSASARNFDVVVNAASSGTAGDYTLGSLTIPAGSYDGTINVDFVDTNLVDLVSYTLILDLELTAGTAVVGSRTATITYNKYLICNDYILTMNEDGWSSERSWDVVDADGTIVESGGGYTSFSSGSGQIVETMTLADGCYTFTIYDSYGDGQYDGVTTGNYSLDCLIINAASGSGNWGSSESTDFCVNP